MRYHRYTLKGLPTMIRFRLKELIAEKGFQENRRVTLDEVSKETGIHRTTLSKIANQRGYNTTTAMLEYLSINLEQELQGLSYLVGHPHRECLYVNYEAILFLHCAFSGFFTINAQM